MLGFLLFTLLLTLLFYSIGLYDQNKNLEIISSDRIENIHNNFHNLEERDTKILSSALEVIIQDQGFKDIYLEKNREKLYNYGQPLFQNLKNKYGITHFYFILPDGHDFIRLHNKEIYGDLIERITFLKASDTKKIASGIELGKTAFALRVVMPYYNNGDLIGYVELGEEIDHIFKILKEQTNGEFAIIVDKEYLNREDWKSLKQNAGLRDNWEDLEKHLIISSTTRDEITSKCFVEDDLERVENGEILLSQLQSKNQTFACGGFTITDAGGRHIGSILSLIDITDQMAVAQQAKYTLLGVAIILFISTFTTGIFISRSISKPIARLSDAANEIGKGNFNTRIEIKSKDEIGELAASFKKMTGDLQNTTVSKDYMENIIRNIYGTLVVVTPEGTIQIVNKATCDLLGYRTEELIGQPVGILFDNETLRLKNPWLDELIKKDSLSNMETTYLAKDGRKIPMLFSSSVMRHNNGDIQGIVFVAVDITERKKTEEICLENERLMRVSKAKSEFLATMSHELRTPLNSIIGFSELMKQKAHGELNEKQEHYVSNVLTSSKHLLGLINDILDLSKVEAEKMEISIEKLPVHESINGTLELIKERALKHNIILEKDFDPALDFMEADSQKFKQVLFNLLSNAVKFSKPEGGTVTVTAKKEGDRVKISVSDTGIGINEDDIRKLFKEFEQLDSGISRKYGGTGLGLVISKKLVELHGGKIWAESKYGEGSTFTFSLPLVAKI